MKPLRVLVVDDTAVYRKIVSEVLNEMPDVEVVGLAHNGRIAMSKIASLKPDLLTLDIEMPEMSGLEVLSRMRKEAPEVGAVMVSTLTTQGGELTMKALELGAFDFIPKPDEGNIDKNREVVTKAIVPILNAFVRRKEIKAILNHKGENSVSKQKTKILQSSSVSKTVAVNRRRMSMKSEIIGIGISTGGPGALALMLPRIPADLGVPILIIQHMPPVFTQSLAKSLNAKCSIEVREGMDGEPLQSNTALIAPGGKQMKVVAGTDGLTRILRVTDDPPENSCRPSVDYLFRSIAHHYVGRATGVIMTGMGSDGTLGLKLMKRNGAIIIAQDEATSTVFGMPKEAIAAGVVDVVVPLENIADEICQTVRPKGAERRLA